jgi:uncharacterized protein (TIGR03437 family)
VGAKPGDVVVLWGTGFGPTNPPVPAGMAVTGTPAATAMPVVTVGGVRAQVVSTTLTPGSAGQYQVTIQMPDAGPAGVVVVQASVGGVTSTDGALMFIAR